MKFILSALLLASIASTANAEGVLFDDVCTAVVSDYDGTEDGVIELHLHCATPEKLLLGVSQATSDWIKDMVITGNLISGETQLQFPAGTVLDNYMLNEMPEVINSDSNIYNDNKMRRLNPSKGDFTVTMVRISSDGAGKSTSVSTSTIKSEVLSTNQVNIMTQLKACSHDQFTLTPASGTGFDGGVTTIATASNPGTGNLSTDYNTFLAYLNSILEQLRIKHGNAQAADFVMLCLPPGTITGTDAIGYFGYFLTVFNSEVCTSLSYNIHEVGHNINLNHASDTIFTPNNGSEYADQIGYMGFSYSDMHAPQMCFNAAKSYQLGWYTDKTYVCTPEQCNPCEVDVGGVVSYDDISVDYVLMKIENLSNDNDYYLTFNDASGFNVGTKEGENQVVINTQPNEGVERDFSQLVGLMDAGDSQNFNFDSVAGNSITVEVVSINNGVASVKVSVPGGECIPEVGGDPHFTTWNHEHYEFHGQCDLVMVKDDKFADGLGLNVHIRSKLVRFWSYIKNVAIRIGNDILEIEGSSNPEHNEATYWINYEYQGELTDLGGFPISFSASSLAKSIYEIDLSSKYPGVKIIIKIYKEFIRVKLHGGVDAFGNTVGLLGGYKTGKTYARDERTILNDFSKLGNEWQVLPGEPKLFHTLESPQFPEKCLEPENPQGQRRRRLGESRISIEQAERACAVLKDPLTIKDCVYDILATQDIDMVGAF